MNTQVETTLLWDLWSIYDTVDTDLWRWYRLYDTVDTDFMIQTLWYSWYRHKSVFFFAFFGYENFRNLIF